MLRFVRRNKKIKLVIFDSGNIILNFEPNAIDKFIEKFYSKYDVDMKFQNKLWKKYEHKVMTGKISHLKANQLVVKQLGLPLSVAKKFKKEDEKFWINATSLFKGEKETLRRLKKDGYKLAILSDAVYTARDKRKIYKNLGINDFFDRYFTSKDIGYAKPHPKAYRRVLKSFKVKPTNAVFVCHSLDEIQGGKRAGMKVICFGDEHAKKAHYHAKKFSDIYQIIQEIDSSNS